MRVISACRNLLRRLFAARMFGRAGQHRVSFEDHAIRESSLPAGPLTGASVAEQSFVAVHDHLSAISVRFGTYRRSNTRDIIFKLYDLQIPENPLAQVLINAAELDDNQFHDFGFQAIPASKGHTYRSRSPPLSPQRKIVSLCFGVRETKMLTRAFLHSQPPRTSRWGMRSWIVYHDTLQISGRWRIFDE
jgi:hypothetical protein